jgi:hypothetical protein
MFRGGDGGSACTVTLTVDRGGGETVTDSKADAVVALFAPEEVSDWLGPFAEAEPEDEAESKQGCDDEDAD